ncbi:UNVERIFIED_CONTAM: Nuclear pore complex protein NUP54 [Sesamum indicum]
MSKRVSRAEGQSRFKPWRGSNTSRSLAPWFGAFLQFLQSRAFGMWEVQHLIVRIVQLQHELGSNVRHIFREGNEAADHLVKDVASQQLTRVMYQEDITGILRGIIRLDKLGTPYLCCRALGERLAGSTTQQVRPPNRKDGHDYRPPLKNPNRESRVPPPSKNVRSSTLLSCTHHPSSIPAFGAPSTPAFGSSLFSTPNSQPSQPQQQQLTPSLFQTPQPQQQQSPFDFTTLFIAASQAQPTLFNNALPTTNFVNSQLTTQMSIKPAGVSDIMWAEAIAKLEGMESSKRGRLWPHLMKGFKDLSQCLKGSLMNRSSSSNERKGRISREVGCNNQTVKRIWSESSRRVQNLLTLSRLQADGLNGGSVYLPASTKIHEQSLANMQEVLQRQTEAIARLENVLKRDMRDMEIIMAEDREMSESWKESLANCNLTQSSPPHPFPCIFPSISLSSLLSIITK